jgi:hypothetical protein
VVQWIQLIIKKKSRNKQTAPADIMEHIPTIVAHTQKKRTTMGQILFCKRFMLGTFPLYSCDSVFNQDAPGLIPGATVDAALELERLHQS